ncbi:MULTISPECIES: HlyD family secretion protein [unclassified Sphingomonas]|uniref:HlyD family secretion protein n=1 Tax=unclassified Sphingomonas TaxID=196159 RepID=UPI0009284345|nr:MULTISPECIES: HlyD family secretion protein [unclassified Sphingomonas]MBN8847606.1 HlyD family secretion protein [Sphingomonas sp.]OJV31532.1 MAG: secretion protein HlyD [Sphingomonas sp. 67-36]
MADADPKREFAADKEISVLSQEDGPAEKRRGVLRLVPMLGVPLLIALVGGYFYITSGRYISTDNAYVRQDMISVSPDVSGRIVEVDVRENQQVKAGDVLFRIDPEPYKIALAQADADLATARVQVSTMATDTGSAAADIQNAKAELTLAQATYSRQTALMKQGFTTRAAFDAATQGVAAANAKLATAQAAAARARQQLGSGGGTGQPAAIQVALAKREKAAYDLERSVVRAPKDGIVSQTGRLQVGNITPSGVPALSLVVSQQAWVEANFKETDLNHMRVGQPAELSFDAYPGLKVKGRVQSIGAGTGSEFSVLPAQNATGNWVKVTQRVPVRIAIDGTPPRAMIAGLSTDVTIDTKAR